MFWVTFLEGTGKCCRHAGSYVNAPSSGTRRQEEFRPPAHRPMFSPHRRWARSGTALEVPSAGGDTMFTNQAIPAYESLSGGMKALVG